MSDNAAVDRLNALVSKLVAAIRPPPNVTVSEWAAQNRVLSPEASAEQGRWRNSRTPYLVEIMDAYSDPRVHHIVVVASSQVANAILLGVLLGGMMCVDLGGPINKAAYAFSVGLLASSSYAPMAATMAAGMVPPIGMAIATVLARRKFADSERQAGKAAGVLGLCFISEGAIPFAAKDPLRVIPACIAGGTLTGALSMYFGCKLMAPHGGLFVLLIPNAINHALLYLLAIVAGSLVTGVLYALIKQGEAQPLVASAQ